jgi:hypothetical protein
VAKVLAHKLKNADLKKIVGAFRPIPVAVFALGLIALIALSLAAGTVKDSESFLLLAALVAYTVYVISSTALALSITGEPKWSWAGVYLAAMLPSVLLISWQPVTAASWPTNLPLGVPWPIKAMAAGLTNAALCYTTALLLLWIATLLAKKGGWRRVVLFATAIILPVGFWMIEVELTLLSRGLG